jgi:hypothetical protein
MTLEEELEKALSVRTSGQLLHREGLRLEFKEQFNLAGLADYLRDFAAFANNRGGLLVFGVTDSPRKLQGLSEKSIDSFDKLDPERMTGHINDNFSGLIEWQATTVSLGTKVFACFKIIEARQKPLICKSDYGKNILRNGDIYFRYGGRTQRIRHSELQLIIQNRMEDANKAWIDHVKQIGTQGPARKAILDLRTAKLEIDNKNEIFVDQSIIEKIKFIREGQFDEVHGEETLKIVGDIKAVKTIEVIHEVETDRMKNYPLSALELAGEIKKACAECGQNRVWEIIKSEGLKDNPEYATYTFYKPSDLRKFEETGEISKNALSIYKINTVDHIVNIFQNSEF